MGSESIRFGAGGVSGASGVGVAYFDCATIWDRGLNVRSTVLYLAAVPSLLSHRWTPAVVPEELCRAGRFTLFFRQDWLGFEQLMLDIPDGGR